MSLAKVSVNPYKHSPTSKWDVDYQKNGKRTREFFRTKKEANTRRDQILIELENLGNKAFAISDDLRLEAVQCAERLAPFKHSLSDAVDFFIRHLEASRNSCSIGELIGDYLSTKSRKQNSERYLSDLNYRLRRFNDAFADKVASTVNPSNVPVRIRMSSIAVRSLSECRSSMKHQDLVK